MTREDARKLIGGYATGSLSEAERRALFEAALEDQDLFDELAREQGFKDLLDSPGAKQRMIAALQPRKSVAWWKLAAAGLIAAVVMAIGTWTTWTAWRALKPVQVARVAQAPAPQPAPKQEPAPPPKTAAKRVTAGAIAPPVKAMAQAAPMAPSAQSQGSLRPAVPRFGFHYAIENQTLALTFDAAGYISIHFSPGDDTIVGARVAAGSTRREALPNNATEADIVFTGERQTTSGGVSLNRETPSGTVFDPAGTRIDLLLRIY